MKKLLVIMIMLTSLATANAQKWETIHIAGDELFDAKETTKMQYSDSIGIFRYEDNDKFQFLVGCYSKSFFSYEYSGSNRVALFMVGLYDDEDTLLEKFTMSLIIDREQPHIAYTWNLGTMSNPVGQKGKVKKILNHIKGTYGYVRIVGARYRDNDFDFKIPHQ